MKDVGGGQLGIDFRRRSDVSKLKVPGTGVFQGIMETVVTEMV